MSLLLPPLLVVVVVPWLVGYVQDKYVKLFGSDADSFVRSFVRSLARSFFGSFVLRFVLSFVASFVVCVRDILCVNVIGFEVDLSLWHCCYG